MFDRLKHMPIDESGTRYLSLGGEARFRYEFFNNAAFGSDPPDSNGYFLKRVLLHADFHPVDRFRLFVQLQSANEAGRVGGPRAEDDDDLDLNQAFADWTMYEEGADHLTLRAGRQELEFGMSRLISARDGLNTRQSFDGLRTLGRAGRWNFNLTLAQTVNTLPGTFDNYSSSQNGYAGASGARPATGITTGRAGFSAANSTECRSVPGTSLRTAAICFRNTGWRHDWACASTPPAATRIHRTVN